jgi:spore coat protein U-like protein
MKRSLSRTLAVITVALAFTPFVSARRAGAATRDKSFNVTATVDAQCSIDAINIDFGTYDVFATSDKTANGAVTVQCTKGAAVRIDLSDGVNGPPRQMSNGSAALNYDLYSDADLSARWGVGATGVNPYGASATATSTAPAIATVYAKLPMGQTNATPGSYSDTVTATVNF